MLVSVGFRHPTDKARTPLGGCRARSFRPWLPLLLWEPATPAWAFPLTCTAASMLVPTCFPLLIPRLPASWEETQAPLLPIPAPMGCTVILSPCRPIPHPCWSDHPWFPVSGFRCYSPSWRSPLRLPSRQPSQVTVLPWVPSRGSVTCLLPGPTALLSAQAPAPLLGEPPACPGPWRREQTPWHPGHASSYSHPLAQGKPVPSPRPARKPRTLVPASVPCGASRPLPMPLPPPSRGSPALLLPPARSPHHALPA